MGLVVVLALAKLLLHLLTNHQYGFHRDELDTLDAARRLAWGYVNYPPLTPLMARIGLELIGPSVVGVRFMAPVAQSISVILVGLLARELGGGRWAQVTAAVAVAISAVSLMGGVMLSYFSFDFLWWVLATYGLARRLRTGDPRWWLLIGAALGLGVLTKYTIGFLIIAIVVGVLLTPVRRDLRSGWLWAGAALSVLIALPNIVWQVQHDFVYLQFLGTIRARDIAWGRTEGFLIEQLFLSANPVTIPLWIAGLWYYFGSVAGRRFRLLGWLAVIPFVLFWAARGRAYYTAPIYPILLTGGVVWLEQWVVQRKLGVQTALRGTVAVLLVLGFIAGAALSLPLAPVNSAWWGVLDEVNGEFAEMIGWPELVQTVAGVYQSLPEAERAQAAILTGNYGEMGAINWYGPDYGLPEAIGPFNNAWYRGYGDPPPATVILLQWPADAANEWFRDCALAATITNRYGVANEESTYRPYVHVCRDIRRSWPELWTELHSYQ
jgi:4-amino-4-deoxy-L-arabinose transferase-like glycosyltransferase